jgi:hypothetical protein
MIVDFNIRPTISEESLEGWVWTNEISVRTRGFIIIENPANGKSIKTFCRAIDGNFQTLYNEKPHTNSIDISTGTFLIINEFYRNLLEIPRTGNVILNIKQANWWQMLTKSHWTHPNPTVQFANRLTIISVILGILALALTIYSVCLTFLSNTKVTS